MLQSRFKTDTSKIKIRYTNLSGMLLYDSTRNIQTSDAVCWTKLCTSCSKSSYSIQTHYLEFLHPSQWRNKCHNRQGKHTTITLHKAKLIEIIIRCRLLSPRKYRVYKYMTNQGPGSLVGIATGYGLDHPGIQSPWGWDFPHLSRPALGPTQPPVQWVPGLFRGKERPGCEADPLTPS